jgi:hypothetical protein
MAPPIGFFLMEIAFIVILAAGLVREIYKMEID